MNWLLLEFPPDSIGDGDLAGNTAQFDGVGIDIKGEGTQFDPQAAVDGLVDGDLGRAALVIDRVRRIRGPVGIRYPASVNLIRAGSGDIGGPGGNLAAITIVEVLEGPVIRIDR